MKSVDFCNNCGRTGHSYNQCKSPITSFGLITYRNTASGPELLMIRRKDSLGFVEFVRGKYPLLNRGYILNILNEMTVAERESLREKTFDELWHSLWSGNVGAQYRAEEKTSREKYDALRNGVTSGKETFTLADLLDEATSSWTETEWGFPKGRRNYQEKDMACALREMEEETGYSRSKVSVVQNLLPLDEVFTGSNYKCYKHRYYIGTMKHDDAEVNATYQKNEVSKCEWMTIDECLKRVRPYNIERLSIIESVQRVLSSYIPYGDE